MKSDFNIQLGERIRAVRKNRNLTRDELSEMLSISTLFLGYIECGQKGMSIQTLYRICQTLNVSADYILFGKSQNDFHKTEAQMMLDNLNRKYHPLVKEYLQLLAKSIFFFEKSSSAPSSEQPGAD